jgi:hypothetical protein
MRLLVASLVCAAVSFPSSGTQLLLQRTESISHVAELRQLPVFAQGCMALRGGGLPDTRRIDNRPRPDWTGPGDKSQDWKLRKGSKVFTHLNSPPFRHLPSQAFVAQLRWPGISGRATPQRKGDGGCWRAQARKKRKWWQRPQVVRAPALRPVMHAIDDTGLVRLSACAGCPRAPVRRQPVRTRACCCH